MRLVRALRFDLSRDDDPTETVAAGCAAEAQGFGVVWLSDTSPRRAIPIAAALAARTRDLRIGLGLELDLATHPLRLAEDAASLDGLSGGRLELALLGTTEPEVLSILEAAWSDGPANVDGERFRVEDLEVTPKPVQHPGPPLWVASPELAVQAGTGCFVADLAAGERFLAAWRSAGRSAAEARVAVSMGDVRAGRDPRWSEAPEVCELQAVYTGGHLREREVS